MATVTKTIRFYTPYLVDENEQRKRLKDGFWTKTAVKVSGLSPAKRTVRHNAMSFFGASATSKSPAANYFRIGRVRYKAEWPGTVDLGSGTEGTLPLTSEQLLENAILLPFGLKNRVAIMGPMRGLVSTAAMGAWLTAVWSLDAKNKSIILVPNVDKTVDGKLAAALGVSRLFVRIPVDAEFEPPANPDLKGGVVQAAMGQATQASAGTFDFEASWSMGTRKKSADLAEQLLQGARYLYKSEGPSKIEANMMIPDDATGFHIETHNLITDHVATSVKFEVDETVALDEKGIITALNDAIKDVT